MKIIAFYLPQFYEFEENNRWWGKGFTEWTNVKKSKPLFYRHYQPRVPLNNNYYNLSNNNVFREQINLAKKFGIYGFCFYHYWFNKDKKLMEKPIESYLNDKTLAHRFCLCWANHNWTRTWIGEDKEILMLQEYGDKDEWRKHFEYLLKFMKDERYIKVDNNPLLVIYQPELIPQLEEMLGYWNNMAKENGFDKICIVSQGHYLPKNNINKKDVLYNIMYEPNYTQYMRSNSNVNKIIDIINSPIFELERLFQRIKKKMCKILKIKNTKLNIDIYNYDYVWKKILNHRISSSNLFPGAFTSLDTTPRRGFEGKVYHGSTPQKFQKYLSMQIERTREVYKKDILFLTAWNEWGEGAYIEPDQKYGVQYLEAVKKALELKNEFPKDI